MLAYKHLAKTDTDFMKEKFNLDLKSTSNLFANAPC